MIRMNDSQIDWFAGVEEVVAEPVKFKLQLAIGEDAYTSLRVKKAIFEVWDAFGAATSAAALAKSSVVASTFFSTSGLLSGIGIGTAATPVGWVIGASVVAGGAWIGITRYLREQTEDRVRSVPEFINTPLDILGLALFDLMAPLALKVAHVDGKIDQSETEAIERWFVRQWGYDLNFVQKGLAFFTARLDEIRIADMATSLARYKQESPDCNYRVMTREVVRFLREVIEADGIIDEREEMAVERIARIFEDEGRLHLGRSAKELGRKLSSSAESAGSAVTEGAVWVVSTTAVGASELGRVASDALSGTVRTGLTGVSRLGALIARRKGLLDRKD